MNMTNVHFLLLVKIKYKKCKNYFLIVAKIRIVLGFECLTWNLVSSIENIYRPYSLIKGSTFIKF